VQDYIADIIFFQGCYFRCPYCFNPEIRSFGKGKEMDNEEILDSLSDISDVVVFSGGDPLHQPVHLLWNLMKKIHALDKKIVIETATYDPSILLSADKVYGSIFCYEPLTNYGILGALDYYDSLELVVVVGYPEFRYDVFANLLKNTNKDIWLKKYNGDVSYDIVKKLWTIGGHRLKWMEKLII
jgi:hypothetical protein